MGKSDPLDNFTVINRNLAEKEARLMSSFIKKDKAKFSKNSGKGKTSQKDKRKARIS
jgi:hypothetical protein